MKEFILKREGWLSGASIDSDPTMLQVDDKTNLDIVIGGAAFCRERIHLKDISGVNDVIFRHLRLPQPQKVKIQITIPIIDDVELKKLKHEEEVTSLRSDILKLQEKLDRLERDYNE